MAVKSLSKVQKIIISTVAGIIAAILIACTAYCVATQQNPSEAAKSISAYVFYDDGTYDSYISTVNFSGDYEVDGSKLYLKNPNTSKEIVYKYKVTEKVLTLTVLEEDGEEPEEDEVSKYDRVDEINQKSLMDILGEFKEETTAAEETE